MDETPGKPNRRMFWRLTDEERKTRPFWGLPGQSTKEKLGIFARQVIYFSVAFGIYHYFTN